MKRFFYSLLFVSLTFFSCVNKNKPEKDVSSHTSESEMETAETGLWELCDVKDEFGDIIGEKCLRLLGNGTYSSEYENEKKLIAFLFVYQDNSIKIRLIKEGSKPVNDFSGHIKIKDGDGDVHDIYFSYDNLGQIEPRFGKESESEFREIVQKEGVMSAIAVENGFLNPNKKTYHFKFNLNGFKKAMKYLPSYVNDTNQYDESESDKEESISAEELEAVKEKIKFNIESESNVESSETEEMTKQITDDDSSESAESNSKVFDAVEQMPSFPGGPGNIFQYLNKSIRYPVDAEEQGVQGKVVCSFIIETDGLISNIMVIKSVYPSLDKEAIRVIKSMPRWIPGKQYGTAVRVKYTVPVTFRLQ